MRSLFKKRSSLPLPPKCSQDIPPPFFATGWLASLILIVTCLAINIYVRLIPAYFPQLRNRAVLGAAQQLFGTEPAPEARRASAGNALKMITPDAALLDKQIEEEYQKLKSPFQSPGGQTYFLDTDSIEWVRYTQNVIQNGHPGDTKVRGESYDSYSLAPLGGATPRYAQLLFYVSAFLYKGMSFFASVPLERFLFFIPVFYAAVLLLAFYAFVRRSFSDLSAFLAVFLTGMSGAFITRTCAGWYDHDALSLLLGLGVTGFLLEALRPGTYKLRWLIFVLLASFFQALLMMAWMGGWFIVPILAVFFLLSAMSTILHCYREPDRLFKEILFSAVTAAVFLVAADFFGYRIGGFHLFSRAFDSACFLYPRWGTSLSPDIWPNVLYTISELSPPKLQELGTFFFNQGFLVAAVIGLFFLVWKERAGRKKEVALMMFCWFVFLSAAAMKSQRFIFLLYLPVFFFLGVLLGDLLPAVLSRVPGGWKRRGATGVFFLGLAFLTVTVTRSGVASAEKIYPLMNDGWYAALAYVEKHTPGEAILNSWWDSGNWCKFYGKRRVIFDPHNQQGQLAYWMARVLLESNERRALAILRMLNNASGRTYNEIHKVIHDPYRSERILERLLDSDRSEGARILEENKVPSGIAQEVLDHLHNRPAPAYLIVDPLLPRRISKVSLIGNWDFTKAFAYAHRREARGEIISALERDYQLTPQKAAWIADITAGKERGERLSELFSSSYSFSLKPGDGKKTGSLTFFDNGVVYGQDPGEVLYYNSERRKYDTLRKVIFYEAGVAREILNDKGDYPKTVVLVKGPTKEQAFIADDPLAASLLVKLYFMGGAGMNSFKPFYSDEENGIFIYEINWD